MNIASLNKSINAIFDRKKIAVYAICLKYAGLIINDFRQSQQGQKYWKNQSFQALSRMMTGAFKEGESVYGVRMAHGVDYGKYLEFANNRQNESIRPTLIKFRDKFFEDVRKVYIG